MTAAEKLYQNNNRGSGNKSRRLGYCDVLSAN